MVENETALIVAEAEQASDDEQATAGEGIRSKEMTDAERKLALDMVRPRAVRADKALATADEKVGLASTEVGKLHALVQAYKLWKAVKDENGKRKYASYTAWYEGQGFLVSKSRASQCVTEFKKELAELTAPQVAEITDGVGDPEQLVTFFASRQAGGSGRTITVQGRAKVIERALSAFIEKVNAAIVDDDGNELDPELTAAVQYLLDLEIGDDLAIILAGDEGTVEEARAS